MMPSRKNSGFTLVEIIIVISIMGIIGGLSSMIIGRSLDSYAALERREKLQTSIRLAVERMSRELRHALPQSICVHDGTDCDPGTGNRFYFIPVLDSGRYQDRPGVYTTLTPPPIQRNRLPVTINRDRFDVVSTNEANALNPDVGLDDWVVVFNPDNTTIYNGPNNIRNEINQVALIDIYKTPADTSDDINQIEFTGNVSFANHSPTRRFHVIDNDHQVTLFYLNGTDLFRDTTTFAAPNTPTGNTRLLMQNVQACTFTYNAGSQTRAGLLRIDITVAQQGEQIQVIHDAHVYNTP